MTTGLDEQFENLVDNFSKIELDENKNVDEQKIPESQEESTTDEGKSPVQGDKEATQIKKLSEEDETFIPGITAAEGVVEYLLDDLEGHLDDLAQSHGLEAMKQILENPDFVSTIQEEFSKRVPEILVKHRFEKTPPAERELEFPEEYPEVPPTEESRIDKTDGEKVTEINSENV